LKNGNGFKFSIYHHNLNFQDVESVAREYNKENYKLILESCRKFIKGFEEDKIEIVKHVTCLYTSTPDKDFIVDYLPGEDKKVVLVSACSGHGFKFTSAIGEMAQRLLDKKDVPLDIFKVDRLLGLKAKF